MRARTKLKGRAGALDRIRRIELALSLLDQRLEFSSPRRAALCAELESLELGFEDQAEPEPDDAAEDGTDEQEEP